MKGIKGLDFFQKINIDNVTQPTFCGALLSLSAISLMIFLLLRELFDFYSPHIKTDSIVIQDSNPNGKIKLNLDLEFNHVPCNLVSLDQQDSLRNHRLDISDTVRKNILTKAGKWNDFSKAAHSTSNHLFADIEKEDGCRLQGYIEIAKVPGDIHVSFHNYRSWWRALLSQKKELAEKVRLSHKFNKWFFGDMPEYKLFKYGLNPKRFYRYSDMPDFKGHTIGKNYDYFIKIIPYMFVDENWGSVEHSYQYSISFKESEFSVPDDEMPTLLMKYEFSPITMRVTRMSRDYLHFLTHVCAIVGGIFVVFSIWNRILSGMFDSDERGSGVAQSK